MSSNSKSSKNVSVQGSLLALTDTDITPSSTDIYSTDQAVSPRAGTVITVDEKHLGKGSASSNSELTQTIPLPLDSSVDVSGWARTSSIYTLVTQDGILRYNGRNLTFTLRTNVAHDTEATNQTINLNYQVRLTYEEKPAENLDFVIKVIDDVPVVSLNTPGAAVSPGSTSYGTWAVNYGADGAATSDGLQVCFNGGAYISVAVNTPVAVLVSGVNYGTLTFYATGAYAFNSNSTASSISLTLGLKATDGDGDVVTGSTTIVINSPIVAVPPIGTGTEVINEANLINGTAPNDQALTKTFAVPEGYTVNTTGWNNQGGIYTSSVNNGMLTYNTTTKTIAFTLTSSIAHSGVANQQNHTVAVPLKNAQGVEVVSSLTVRIEDDLPLVSVNSSETNPGETCQGGWSVSYGADGAAATQSLQVKFGNGAYQSIATESQVAVVINGTNLGSIVFHSNNQYSFTANASATNTNFEMALRATDHDGDFVTQNTNIAITGTTQPVEPPAFLGSSSVILSEEHLSNGRFPSEEALIANFPIPTGFTVVTTNWVAQGAHYTLAVANGTLTYAPDTNTLSFTLESTVTHEQGSDSSPYSVNVSLIDADQKIYEVPVLFTIADDNPLITLNSNTSETTVGSTVNGDWNILFGADGPAAIDSMAVSFDNGATYQSIVIGAAMNAVKDGKSFGTVTFEDGSYSFVPSATGALSFSIKGQDADGDAESLMITVNVTDGTGPTPGTVAISVNEINLLDGNDPNATLLTKVITLPTGSTVDVTSGSWTNNQDTIWTSTTNHGSLVYDQATNILTYTLTGPISHEPGTEYDDIRKEEVSITLLDNNIQTPLNIVVSIIDDAPVLSLNQAGSGSIVSGGTVSGAWDVSYGADDKEILELSINNGTATQVYMVTAGETQTVTINGTEYGYITFSSNDNSYNFVSKEGAKGTLTLTLMATDRDGDVTSSTPATITITTETPPLPGVSDVYLAFDEANLYNGSTPDYDALVRSISLPEGYTVDTSGWVQNGSMYSLAVNSGVFRYNGRNLTFTLRTSSDHDITLNNEEIIKEYVLTLKDASDTTYNLNVSLTIQDDTPDLYFGHNTGEITAGSSTNGMWVASFGADGKAANGMQVSFDGGKTYYDATVGTNVAVLIDEVNYGRITFNASGTYTFKANAAIPNGAISVTLKITDGDGDIAKQDLTLTVSGGITPAPAFEDFTISEASLNDGTNANIAACSHTLTVPEGYTVSTIGWTKVAGGGYTTPVAGGAFFYQPATNVLTYSLSTTIEHGKGPFDDSFSLTKSISLVGPGGELTFAPVTVTIVDDAPVVSFTNSSSWSVNFGADNAADSNALSISFNGKNYVTVTYGEPVEIVIDGTVYGSVTFNTDNTCVFTAAPGKEGSLINVTLKATDSDGDSTTQSLSVTLAGGETPPPVNLGDLGFFEEDLANGTSPGPDALSKTVTLDAGTTVNTTSWTQSDVVTVWTTTSGNYSLKYDSVTNQITVTMVSAIDHPGDGKDIVTEPLTIALLVNGTETTGTLNISVTDDAPVVTFTADETTVEAGSAITGTWAAIAGADGEAATDYLQISFDNGVTYMPITVGTAYEVMVNGKVFGSIEFTQEGTYSFLSANDASGAVTLTLKATDGEGDFTTQTLSLAVTESGVTPVNLGDLGFFEEDLANGTSPGPDALSKTVTLDAGTTVNTTSWTQSDVVTVWTTTSGNYSLKYDSVTNQITVTMVSAIDHPGDGKDIVTEPLTIALLVNGTETTGTLNISVTDDAPVVTFTADETTVEAGSAITGTWAAIAGADGEAATDYLQISFDNGVTYMPITVGTAYEVMVNGKVFGSIEFTQEGTYSFLSANDASGAVTLTLKATDGEGDFTTQTLSLAVTESGVTPVNLGDLGFFEEDLANGTSPGPDALSKTVTLDAGTTVNTTSWTQSDVVTVWTTTSGNYSLKYDSVTNQITVTMVSAIDHPGDGKDIVTEPLTIALLVNGTETTGTLNISVTDDAPVVTFTADETTVEAGSAITGTWAAIAGADGEAATDYLQISFDNGVTYMPITVGTAYEVMVNGKVFGSIEFTQEGTYSFLSANDASGAVTLTLKATDGEGDFTTQTLSLAVTESGVTPVNLGDLAFAEEYLTNGTSPDPEALSKTVTLDAGTTVNTTSWTQSDVETVWTTTSGNYSLKYDSVTNQITVTMVSAISHPGEDNDIVTEPLTIALLVSGTETTGTLNISVTDDAPVVMLVPNSTSIIAGETLTGAWAASFGADGAATTDSLHISFDNGVTYMPITVGTAYEVMVNGKVFGSITFNQDETFAFISNDNANGPVTFIVKAVDSDGDSTTQNMFLTISGTGPDPVNLGDLAFAEEYLTNGTSPDPDALSKTVTLDAGTTVNTTSWTQSDVETVWTTTSGNYSLKYDSVTNQITVTMVSAISHPGEDNDIVTEPLTIALLVSGTETTGTLNISVTDDAPVVMLVPNSTSIIAGETLTGAWAASFGADGAATTDSLHISFDNGVTYMPITVGTAYEVMVNGKVFGSITFNQDETFAFISNDNANGPVTFIVKAVDSDGDSTTQNMFLTISGTGPDPVNLGNLAFTEEHLTNGTSPDPDALSKTVTLDADTAVDTAGWTQSDVETVWTTTSGNYSLKYDSVTNQITVTMVSAISHPDEDNVVTEPLTIALLVNGTETTGTLNISVTDDAPVVTFTAGETTVEAGSAITGTWAAIAGADGEAATDYLQISFDNGVTYSLVTVGTSHAVIKDGTTYGTIEFTQGGTYSFLSANDASGTVTLTLKATDSDGDSTPQTLSLTVTGSGVTPISLGAITLDEQYTEVGTNYDSNEIYKFITLPANTIIDTTGWNDYGSGFWSTLSADRVFSIAYDSNIGQLSVYLFTNTSHSNEGRDTSVSTIPLPILFNGEKAIGNLTISVVDDAPIFTLTSDASEVKAGETLNGKWEHFFGADGGLMLDYYQVSFDNGATYQTFLLNQPTTVIYNDIEYGSLIMMPDNLYSFESKAGTTGTIDFILKLTDGDGDSTTQSQTITITGAGGPTPISLDAITLDESYLAAGTAPDAQACTQTIDLNNLYTVDTTGWTNNGSVWTSGVSPYLFTYNADTKALTVTLTEAVSHDGAGKDGIIHTLTLPLLDADGKAVAGSLSITTHDDIPVITVPSVKEEIEVGGIFTGKYELNYGADGKAENDIVQVSFDGGVTYTNIVFGTAMPVLVGELIGGSVLFTEDGSYTFTGASNISGNLVISLKAVDSEGDAGVTHIEIVIAKPGEPGAVTLDAVTLDESYLAAGTAPDAQACTQTIDLNNLYTVDTTGWTNNGSVWTSGVSPYLFTYDADTKALTVTLTEAVSHDGAGKDGIIHTLTLPLLDADGKAVAGSLSITTHDDIPVITVPSVKEEIEAGGIFTGKYELNYGADGKAENDIVQVSFDGGVTYTNIVFGTAMPVLVGELIGGSVLFTEDGSYTFTGASNISGNLVISLKAVDSEGDAGVTHIEIVIAKPGEPGAVTLDAITLDESYLAAGTAPDAQACTQTIDLNNLYTVDTTGWTNNGSVWTSGVSPYLFTYDADTKALTITLTEAVSHDGAGKDGIIHTLTLPLLDADGKAVAGSLSITTHDDIPVITVPSVKEEIEVGGIFTGKYELNYGADGKAENDIVQVSFDGGVTYTNIVFGTAMPVLVGELIGGSVLFTEDGSYTFTGASNISGNLVISLKAVDSEGDAGVTHIEIVIAKPGEPGAVTLDAITLDESYLAAGTAPDAQACTQTIDLNNLYTVDTTGWTNNGSVWTSGVSPYLFTYDADTKALTVTLTEAVSHDGAGKDGIIHTLTLPLLDADGKAVAGSLSITTHDDIPVITVPSVKEEIEVGGIFTGKYELNYGADGKAENDIVQVSFDGGVTYTNIVFGTAMPVLVGELIGGSVLFTEDGSYTFTGASNISGNLVISLKAVDSEGDAGVTHIEIVIAKPGEPGAVTLDAITLDESYLAAGTAPDAQACTQTIDLNNLYTVDTTGWTNNGSVWTSGVSPYLFTYDADTKALTVTLTEAVSHDGAGKDGIIHTLTLPLLDADGKAVAGSLSITTHDDIPVITVPSVKEEIEVGGIFTGKYELNYGADGKAENDIVQVSFDGGVTYTNIVFGTAMPVLVGELIGGSVLFTEDGSYTFTGASNISGNLVISLKAVDSEGDAGVTHIEIVIAKPGETPVYDLGQAFFDEKGLEQGTAPDPQSILHTVTLPTGYSIDTATWEPKGDGFTTIVDKFLYTYTPGTNVLTFNLIANFAHEIEGNDIATTVIELMAKDAQDNPVLLKLDASIGDDAPLVTIESDAEMVAAGDMLSGKWSVLHGADGALNNEGGAFEVSFDNEHFVPVSIGTAIDVMIKEISYGTIVFKDDKTFTFTAKAGVEGTIPVSLRASDSEIVDISYADVNLVIVEQMPDPGLIVAVSVSEKNLTGGTSVNNAALTKIVTLPDTHTLDTSTGWEPGVGTILTRALGDYGRLTYDTNSQELTFTLIGPIDHGNTDSLVKNISLNVLGANSQKETCTLSITIADDAPTTAPIFSLNVLDIPSEGSLEGMFMVSPNTVGADGNGGTKLRCTDPKTGTTQIFDIVDKTPLDITLDGKPYGSFTFSAESYSFVFKAADGASGTLSLNLLLADGDGDFSASVTQTLTIHKNAYLDLNTIEVLESNLANGTSDATGYATGRIDLPENYKIDIASWTSSTQNGQSIFTKIVEHGTLSYNPINSFFFYTLKEAIANTLGDDNAYANIAVMLSPMKHQDISIEAQFAITIQDDIPLISFSNSGYVQVVSDTQFTSTWHINYGADGQHAQQPTKLDVSANGNGEITTIDIIMDQPVALMVGNKNYGQIMFESATGKYHITANKEYEGDTIQLALKGLDTDGDTGVSGQLSFTIIKGEELPEMVEFGRSIAEVLTLDSLVADEGSLDNLLATLPTPANTAVVAQETTLQPVSMTPVYIEPQSNAEEDMLRALSNTL